MANDKVQLVRCPTTSHAPTYEIDLNHLVQIISDILENVLIPKIEEAAGSASHGVRDVVRNGGKHVELHGVRIEAPMSAFHP